MTSNEGLTKKQNKTKPNKKTKNNNEPTKQKKQRKGIYNILLKTKAISSTWFFAMILICKLYIIMKVASISGIPAFTS